MNEEICCIINKGKRKTSYEWMKKYDTDIFQDLCSVCKIFR